MFGGILVEDKYVDDIHIAHCLIVKIFDPNCAYIPSLKNKHLEETLNNNYKINEIVWFILIKYILDKVRNYLIKKLKSNL